MAWQIPAAMVAGSLISSYMGNKGAKEQSQAAMAEAGRMRQAGLAELQGIDPLSLPEFIYSPEELQYLQGPTPIQYGTPEEYQAQDVQIDPATRQAQMQALSELQQRGEEGLSAADKYNFMRNRRQAETSARGQEEAIIENLRQRGMGGTGVEAALRMQASQGGTDRLAQQQALEAMANAQQRLMGTQAQAGLAGDIRGQDVGQAKTNADILNEMAWRNSERSRQVQNMNVDLRNQAAQSNVAEQRNVQAQNVGQRNQAALMQEQAKIDKAREEQTNVQALAQMRANALTGGTGDIYASGAANAAGQRQMWNTIGAGVGTAGNLYMQSQANDRASQERAADRQLQQQQNQMMMQSLQAK